MKRHLFAIIGATVGNTEHYKIRNSPSPLITVMNRQRRCRILACLIQSHTLDMHQWVLMSRATGCGTFCAGKMKRRKNIPKPLQLIFPNPGKSLKPPPESRCVLAYPGGQFDALSESVLRSLGVKATPHYPAGQGKADGGRTGVPVSDEPFLCAAGYHGGGLSGMDF